MKITQISIVFFAIALINFNLHAEIKGTYSINTQNTPGCTQAQKDELNLEMHKIGQKTLQKLTLLYAKYASTINPQLPLITLVCTAANVPSSDKTKK